MPTVTLASTELQSTTSCLIIFVSFQAADLQGRFFCAKIQSKLIDSELFICASCVPGWKPLLQSTPNVYPGSERKFSIGVTTKMRISQQGVLAVNQEVDVKSACQASFQLHHLCFKKFWMVFVSAKCPLRVRIKWTHQQ